MIRIICLVVLIFADNFPEIYSSKVIVKVDIKIVMSPILFIRSSDWIEKEEFRKLWGWLNKETKR